MEDFKMGDSETNTDAQAQSAGTSQGNQDDMTAWDNPTPGETPQFEELRKSFSIDENE